MDAGYEGRKIFNVPGLRHRAGVRLPRRLGRAGQPAVRAARPGGRPGQPGLLRRGRHRRVDRPWRAARTSSCSASRTTVAAGPASPAAATACSSRPPGPRRPPSRPGYEDYKVLKTLAGNGYTVHRDLRAGHAWLFDGTTFWTYDDPAVVMQKTLYIRRAGLGGADDLVARRRRRQRHADQDDRPRPDDLVAVPDPPGPSPADLSAGGGPFYRCAGVTARTAASMSAVTWSMSRARCTSTSADHPSGRVSLTVTSSRRWVSQPAIACTSTMAVPASLAATRSTSVRVRRHPVGGRRGHPLPKPILGAQPGRQRTPSIGGRKIRMDRERDHLRHVSSSQTTTSPRHHPATPRRDRHAE